MVASFALVRYVLRGGGELAVTGRLGDRRFFASASLFYKSLSQSRNFVVHRDPGEKALRVAA